MSAATAPAVRGGLRARHAAHRETSHAIHRVRRGCWEIDMGEFTVGYFFTRWGAGSWLRDYEAARGT